MSKTPITPAKYRPGGTENPLNGVDWNNLQDSLDLDIWNRLTMNFWLDTKIPLAKDLQSWATLSEEEQTATMRVFTGLTLLDTIQGTVGAVALIADARTQQEEANLTNMAFMESVHAKSYSSIFMTLATGKQIDEAFRWSQENEHLQRKARAILNGYHDQSPELRKIASVMLESFLFYSGFYLPLRFSSLGKLTNTADIIRLIIRDEAIHGYYIGYKYQRLVSTLSKTRRDQLQDQVLELMLGLYENELRYTHDIYGPIGWASDVEKFLRYNANKALQNLGYEGVFPADSTDFHNGVMTSLDPSTNENHDFFSGSGSSYIIGKAEETRDEDWSF